MSCKSRPSSSGAPSQGAREDGNNVDLVGLPDARLEEGLAHQGASCVRSHIGVNASESLNPWLLLLTIIFLAATLCLGVVGAVMFHLGPSIDAPDGLLQDPTFYIIFSQAIPNALHGIFELIKGWDKYVSLFHGTKNGSPSQGIRHESPWYNTALLLVITLVVIGLSVAAPTYYGVSNRSETWTQVVTMILSMATALGVIFAGFLSANEGRYSLEKSLSEALSKKQLQCDEIEKRNKVLHDQNTKHLSNVVELRNNVTELHGNIERLKDEVTEHQNNVAILQDRIQELENEKKALPEKQEEGATPEGKVPIPKRLLGKLLQKKDLSPK